jgi:hypothetical protein
MPADALFEVMAGCVTRVGFGPGMVSEGARLRGRPLHRQTQCGGLKPPLQRPDFRSRRETVSTTELGSFVVENGPKKPALKVLVESFLLAFCTKCRRADIFHRIAVTGSDGRRISRFLSRKPSANYAAEPTTRVGGRPQKAARTFGKIQASAPLESGVVPCASAAVAAAGSRFCRDRLLRRSARYWADSIIFHSANFIFRSEATLPLRQDSSRSFTQSKSKRGIS